MHKSKHIKDQLLNMISKFGRFIESDRINIDFYNQPVFLTILELTILVRIGDILLKSGQDIYPNQKSENLINLEYHISLRVSFILSQTSKSYLKLFT